MAKRPSAKQLAARRAFAARYGGKKSRSASRPRKVKRMANKARRYASASRSFGGKSKPLIDGALAGAATPFAVNYLGPRFGAPAALVGVGMFRRNDTLTTLGAFSLAAGLVAGSGMMGTAAATPGGYL